MNIDLLLQALLSFDKLRMPGEVIRFIGNGAELYRNKINASFDSRIFIPDPLPQSSSVEQLRILGLAQWRNQTAICTQLQPIYLKQIKTV
jgi:hypothetical protein